MITYHLGASPPGRSIKKSRLAPSNPISTWLRLFRIAVPQYRFDFGDVIGVENRQSAIT
jgi:hypothetical protein